jgi:phosphoglucosamine mutase
LEIYLDFLSSIFPKDLEGLKIVVDCAHGSTSKVAPILFKELKAEVIAINNSPNGININQNCGSLYPEVAREAVLKYRADLGLSFDGDGDRLIAIDEKGNIIDGDFIMVICAKYLKEVEKLKNNLLIVTQMSNFGLEEALKKLEIEFIRTKVGDRYVIKEMMERDAIIGGEQSGHIIFRDIFNTGDGLITSLKLLEVMKEKDKTLSQLASVMQRYPQVLFNVKVKKKIDFNDLPEVKETILKAKERIKNRGRILVRYSGTELLARVMVEGISEEEIVEIAKNISESIERCIGI